MGHQAANLPETPSLKVGDFNVASWPLGDPLEIAGLIVGDVYGVHKKLPSSCGEIVASNLFAVTHLRTGLAMPCYLHNKSRAIEFAYALLREFNGEPFPLSIFNVKPKLSIARNRAFDAMVKEWAV